MGKKTDNHSADQIRKANGKIGELLVAVELLRHGFQVSWPMIDKGYDLISDSQEGSLKRVQVKTARPNKYGTYDVNFIHGHRASKSYTSDDCDAFVVALSFNSYTGFYVIPLSEVDVYKGVFWPSGQHPRYPDKWKTCKWEDYLYRWDLLR